MSSYNPVSVGNGSTVHDRLSVATNRIITIDQRCSCNNKNNKSTVLEQHIFGRLDWNKPDISSTHRYLARINSVDWKYEVQKLILKCTSHFEFYFKWEAVFNIKSWEHMLDCAFENIA